MKKLLYLIGIIIPSFGCAQGQNATVIPASDKHELDVYYVDNSPLNAQEQTFSQKNFGGFYVQNHIYVKKDLKRFSDRFWVWVSFGITSMAIIGLLIVFNRLKKNFNKIY